jgi:WD40 repeat protein
VDFSLDGQRIVTTSDDSTARVWDSVDGRLLATLRGHAQVVYSAAFSPDGKCILTSSYDQTARLWRLLTLDDIQHTLVK